ncbi:hypothetical protein EVAR_51129_1 [Eumeta japonica]|uniref:Histone-lysine N-methyltransferase SETMAR n=1 Tax=Eumeta variegata TaxID=151549 RepID=A0A4C1YB09_EUMVA|nr:hypothetical protein EVAR_51129_1 [Eumeta japonica]
MKKAICSRAAGARVCRAAVKKRSSRRPERPLMEPVLRLCMRDVADVPLFSGDVNVKDEPRSSRSVTEKVEPYVKPFWEKIEQDRHISSYNVAEELGIFGGRA